MTPDYPASARVQDMGPVEVSVTVWVDERGAPTRAEITKSSGNDALDGTSMKMALQATFLPKLIPVNSQAGDSAPSPQKSSKLGAPVCGTPVASKYIFTVTFDPNG